MGKDELEITELSEINDDLKDLSINLISGIYGEKFTDLFASCVGKILGIAKSRGYFNNLFSKGMGKVKTVIETFLNSSKNMRAGAFDKMILEITAKTKQTNSYIRYLNQMLNATWQKLITYEAAEKIRDSLDKNLKDAKTELYGDVGKWLYENEASLFKVCYSEIPKGFDQNKKYLIEEIRNEIDLILSRIKKIIKRKSNEMKAKMEREKKGKKNTLTKK